MSLRAAQRRGNLGQVCAPENPEINALRRQRQARVSITKRSLCTAVSHKEERNHGPRTEGQESDRLCGKQGARPRLRLSLAREGVDVVITARTAADLEKTADEIRKETGVKVTPVPGDITTEAGRAAALAACPQPDILVNNAGGPPRGDFREWGRDDWMKAVDANMLAPIFLIKAVVDGMIERKFGRIVNITSAIGEVANPGTRHEQRRACRPHRFRRRPGAPDRPPQRDHQ